MRPLLKTSTALLASLSLLAPSLLNAQIPVTDDQVGTEMPEAAETPPSDMLTEEGQPATAPAEPQAVEAQVEPAPMPEQDITETAPPVPDTTQDSPQPAEAEAAETIPDPALPEASTDPAPALQATPEDMTAPVDSPPAPDSQPPAPSEPTIAPIPADQPAPQQDAIPAPDTATPPGAAPDLEPNPGDEGPSSSESTAEDQTDALKQALEQEQQKQELTDSPAPQDEAAQPGDSLPDSPASALEGSEDATGAVIETPDTTVDLSSQPAPEADAVETDLSREAANPTETTESEALKAVLDKADDQNTAEAPQGEVSDFTVTDDNTRSSDEDFLTSTLRSIADGGESPQAEAKDNKTRDLARLALAGMAGLAVGKMLSDNRKVALNTGDRVVVTLPDGSQQLIKDEDTLLFQPGSNVQTQRYADGSSITTVRRDDGSQVVTIRDANMNILRRSVLWPDGRSTMLIDDTGTAEPVVISKLPPPARPVDYTGTLDEQALRDALMRESDIGRHFTLGQIRNIAQVRALVAPLDIQSITFDTGSAAITPDQAAQLSTLGRVITDTIHQNPNEVFMIEGYTDAIGSDASNLALSDRRAESVALALTEYFRVPPENMIVQGYGEQFLRIQTLEAERANRRVAVRRITDLLARN